MFSVTIVFIRSRCSRYIPLQNNMHTGCMKNKTSSSMLESSKQLYDNYFIWDEYGNHNVTLLIDCSRIVLLPRNVNYMHICCILLYQKSKIYNFERCWLPTPLYGKLGGNSFTRQYIIGHQFQTLSSGNSFSRNDSLILHKYVADQTLLKPPLHLIVFFGKISK